MKKLAFVLVCLLVCAACAKKPMKTLSDGQPGYALHCETFRSRCLDELTLLCGDAGYQIVSERASEWFLPLGWGDPEWMDYGGVHPKFNSRYWMEARCGQ